MCFKTAAEAIRAFQSWCQDKESNLYKFASDYTLVELGEFDEPSASIATHNIPRILSNASEFKQNIIQSIPANELEIRN